MTASSSPTPISMNAPLMLGKQGGKQAQGELFASALLPRAIPVLKSGPEDDRLWRPRKSEPLH